MADCGSTGRVPDPDRVPVDGLPCAVGNPGRLRRTLDAIAEEQRRIARG